MGAARAGSPASGGIEFGLLLHTRRLMDDAGNADFAPLWDQAGAAEAAGYDHVWLGDSVTVLNRARGDCLTLMAGLAVATRTIAIGTVPLLMSLRHPTTLAHALATIDVISQGRLRIAASAGPVADYMSRQFAACGVPPTEKAGRLTETIALVRRLWAEERVTFEGRYFRIDNAGILPKPVQKPVPIWIATGGTAAEAALKRVARIGDGWVSTGPTAADFAAHRRVIDGFAAGYGRSPAEVATSHLFAAVRCETDGDRARREGWDWMVSFFRRPRERLEGTFTPIFGTPEECARELAAYAKAGMTGLIARIASDDLAGQTDALLTKVRPGLTDLA